MTEKKKTVHEKGLKSRKGKGDDGIGAERVFCLQSMTGRQAEVSEGKRSTDIPY